MLDHRVVSLNGISCKFFFTKLNICEVVTGPINFLDLGTTCVGNLVAFVTTLIRGRLNIESGARDALSIVGCRKLTILNEINENEVTTGNNDTIVMLSNGPLNIFMR